MPGGKATTVSVGRTEERLNAKGGGRSGKQSRRDKPYVDIRTDPNATQDQYEEQETDYYWTWYCCQCLDSPTEYSHTMLTETTDQCLNHNCQHVRCHKCRLEAVSQIQAGETENLKKGEGKTSRASDLHKLRNLLGTRPQRTTFAGDWAKKPPSSYEIYPPSQTKYPLDQSSYVASSHKSSTGVSRQVGNENRPNANMNPSQPSSLYYPTSYGVGTNSFRHGIGFPPQSGTTLSPRSDEFLRPGPRSQILEKFRSSSTLTRFEQWELKDIRDHVVEFSGDQDGSRFIHEKLRTANSDEIEHVFQEILPSVLLLTKDVFGNFVILVALEYGNDEQKRLLAAKMKGSVVELSLNMYGCRVAQKVLGNVSVEQQVELVKELEPAVGQLIKDQNGYQVLQKAIQAVPRQYLDFVIDAVRGQVADLASHPHGCRVIQRMLEYGTEQDKETIIRKVLLHADKLIFDQYGNYVVRHVVQYGTLEARSIIVDLIHDQVGTLSMHKSASSVVGKCIQHGTLDEQMRIRKQLIGTAADNTDLLQQLVRDAFGRYVILKLISQPDWPDGESFIEDMKQRLTSLVETTPSSQQRALQRMIDGLDNLPSAKPKFSIMRQPSAPETPAPFIDIKSPSSTPSRSSTPADNAGDEDSSSQIIDTGAHHDGMREASNPEGEAMWLAKSEAIDACVQLILNNPAMAGLPQEALRDKRFGMKRLLRNLHRLLKILSGDLLSEYQKADRRKICSFFGAHYRQISLGIVSAQPQDDIFDDPEFSYKTDTKGEVVDFLALKDLVEGSYSFRAFVRNMHDLVHPSFSSSMRGLIEKEAWSPEHDLRGIKETVSEILYSQPSEIGITENVSLSWLDRTRVFLDGYSSPEWEWDWWPLAPGQKPLQSDHSRLSWQCICGDRRTADVVQDFAQQLIGIFNSTPPKLTQMPHSAGTVSTVKQTQRDHRSGDSKPAPVGYPPQTQIGGGSSSTHQGAPIGLVPLAGSRDSQAIQMPQMGRYVHFLVDTGSLQLSPLDSQSKCNGRFFHELKTEYYRKKGWLSSWFGFKKFSHCEFCKFESWTTGRYGEREPGIPPFGHSEYFYDPKPMDREPPITKHEFYDRFYNRVGSCCASEPSNCEIRDAVDRIPQKHDMTHESRSQFWGIIAREKKSRLTFLIYLLLASAPGFIFFFIWLFPLEHSGDLQNASVLIMMSITLLGVLYASQLF